MSLQTRRIPDPTRLSKPDPVVVDPVGREVLTLEVVDHLVVEVSEIQRGETAAQSSARVLRWIPLDRRRAAEEKAGTRVRLHRPAGAGLVAAGTAAVYNGKRGRVDSLVQKY